MPLTSYELLGHFLYITLVRMWGERVFSFTNISITFWFIAFLFAMPHNFLFILLLLLFWAEDLNFLYIFLLSDYNFSVYKLLLTCDIACSKCDYSCLLLPFISETSSTVCSSCFDWLFQIQSAGYIYMSSPSCCVCCHSQTSLELAIVVPLLNLPL